MPSTDHAEESGDFRLRIMPFDSQPVDGRVVNEQVCPIGVQFASYEVRVGDCLALLKSTPAQSFHSCVTSPPYWGLRDYGIEGQIGAESTIEEYVENLVKVFREVRRTLQDDGTLWL